MATMLGCVIVLGTALCTQLVILRCSQRVPALGRHRHLLTAIAVGWYLTVAAKTLFEGSIFTPPDASDHEAYAREIASLLNDGRFRDALAYCGFGNKGFRFLLGVFYAVTGAPQFCVLGIYAALSFTGLLSVLEVVCRRHDKPHVPAWLVIVACATPSALFYCTTNLKEALVLWGGCAMLRYLAKPLPSQRKEFSLLPALGLLVAGFLRPHIAVGWALAIGVGNVAGRHRFRGVAVALFCIFAAQSVLQMYRPDLVERISNEGLTTTMSRFYEKNASFYGGSSITYRSGRPTPVVSGVILLFARPLPSDVFNLASAAAGLEIWCITGAVFASWLGARRRFHLASDGLTIALITAVVIFSFYFTYMYNMGLMVRQRTQILPVLIGLAAVPATARRLSRLDAGTVTLPNQPVPRFDRRRKPNLRAESV